MVLISWESIIAALVAAWSKRNEPKYWSGWISGDGPNRKVLVTAVSLEETGLNLAITDGSTKHDLKAVPKDLEHTEVVFDGTVIPEAAMVFAPKPSLGDLSRFAFDFRPLPLNGKSVRFNMRFDAR